MSKENVAFVQGLLAAVAGAEEQTLLAGLPELITQTCDPEIEWIEDPGRADGRIGRGHAGVQLLRYREFLDEQAARQAAGLQA